MFQPFRFRCAWKPLLTVCSLALCEIAYCAPVAMPSVEELTPLRFPERQAGRFSILTKTVVHGSQPLTPIGEIRSGLFCRNPTNIYWDYRLNMLLASNALFAQVFRSELEKFNYPVPPVSDEMFAQQTPPAPFFANQNALQVGVSVKDIGLNLCIKGTDKAEGEAYLKLFWQVFAPEQQIVVFETTTLGRFNTPMPVSGGLAPILSGALIMAIRNLLADPGFIKVVKQRAQPIGNLEGVTPSQMDDVAGKTDKKAQSTPILTVAGIAGNAAPLSQKMPQLRSAMATVYGEHGSGSGFFIGTDGYMLTNKHVVGDAKYVTIRMATGEKLIGQSVRADGYRDIALIKTTKSGATPMALRLTEPDIGEDVYALGSPLGETFSTTLTKGILSSYRTFNNQRFLQSDVAVQPGNSGGPLLDKSGQVIGITVMKLSNVTGMSFFIPISEAIEKLSLQILTPYQSDSKKN